MSNFENLKTWNWPQFILAMLALVALIALTVIEQMTGKHADDGSRQVLIAFTTLAFGYFFGSSVQSKSKDAVIATQAATAQAATAPPDIRITTAAMESGPSTPLAAVVVLKSPQPGANAPSITEVAK